MGSDYYETPHMDRLASQGMVFTDAYANGPVCAPTRACLMSGQYTPRHGVHTVWKSERKPNNKRRVIPIPNVEHLSSESVTFMELLKERGYIGASIGKWHLGRDPDEGPLAQGFDVNIAGNATGSPAGGHFSPYENPNLADGPEGEYLTDRLTTEALQFLDRHHAQPFFLFLTHYAVHDPIQAPQTDSDYFRRKPPAQGQGNATYAAMIKRVDDGVGRILARLEALGASDNTFVMMTSDNGGHGCITSHAPLRGSKGMLYEGGIRVPMVVRWPGQVEPGSRCDTPVMTIDFYPTYLDIARVPAADDRVLDGLSLVPLLKQTGSLNREALYWHFPAYLQRYSCIEGYWRTTPVGVIRKGPWKLLEFFTPEGSPNLMELYHLPSDMGERLNLVAEKPDKVKELLADLGRWREEIDAPVPIKANPLYDAEAEPDGFDWQ